MNKLRISVLLFFAFLLLLFPTLGLAKDMSINLETSRVDWLGKKVAGQHNGYLKLKGGKVTMEADDLKSAEFVLDMTSIENEDLKSPKYKAKLENHLKSDDFFNVATYPEGKFVLSTASKQEDGSYLVEGTLSIKDKTNPVKFAVNISQAEGVYHAKGKVKIDRTKWDIKYNSGKFFDPANLGDKLIYDEIEIGIDVQTVAG